MATDKRFIKVNGEFVRPEDNPYFMGEIRIGNGGQTVTSGADGRTLPGTPPVPPNSAPGGASFGGGSGSFGGGSQMPPGGNSGAPSTPMPGNTGVPGSSGDTMNALMMSMLKSVQGISPDDLIAKKQQAERDRLALVRESNARAGAPLEGDLSHLSPAQQSAIRAGSISALGDEIDYKKYEIQKAQDSLDNYYKAIEQISKVSDEFADKLVAPDSVITNAKKVIENNPEMMNTILSGFNDKSKQKIIESLDYETLTTNKKKTGTTPGQTTDNERALLSLFRQEKIVQNFNENLNKKLSVQGILDLGVGGPGDLAIVYEFMKALDPTSVVRETEYDTAAKSGNIFAGAFARYNGYLKEDGGILPEAVKRSFMSIINAKFAVAERQYQNVVKEYETMATRQGLNPENVIINYSSIVDQPKSEVEKMRGQLEPGEILVSRETPTGRKYAAIKPSELWATDIKL